MRRRILVLARVLRGTLCSGITLWVASCGGGGGSSAPPGPPPNSSATVVISSDANDQLTAFGIEVQSLTLTSDKGDTVTVSSKSQTGEFMLVNGAQAPFATATIPQGTYTGATVVVGGASFQCESVISGSITTASYAYGQTPSAQVSLTLPQPLVIDSDSVGLKLNLLVGSSASLSLGPFSALTATGPSCGASDLNYMITPTFTLTAFALANEGGVNGLEGEITGTTASGGFQLASALGAESLTVTTDASTQWQGISGSADIKPGLFVDLDGALQADGSLSATRVSVADPAAVNVRRGPVIFVAGGVPELQITPLVGQGPDQLVDVEQYTTTGTLFQISPSVDNVGALPFAAVFNATTVVPGQSVYVTAPAGETSESVANTITLMPQVVNAEVLGISQSGSFTIYQVQLSSDDLFAILQTAPGTTNLLSYPSTLYGYVDGNAQMLSTSAPAVGQTLRFYGLVFDDGGTLRMDCTKILDGLPLQSLLSSG